MRSQAWYDEFYAESKAREDRPELAPWYRVILEEMQRDHQQAGDHVLELGCGRAPLLLTLADFGHAVDTLHGMEQSTVALSDAMKRGLDVRSGDIMARLPFDDGSMSGVVMAEVIEHLETPDTTLREIYRVLRPGGKFYLSFPNYNNLPWLAKRLAAQALNKPEWIVLQPVDRIYFFRTLRKRVEGFGLAYVRSSGSVFLPPGLFRRETPALRTKLSKAGLTPLAFHPVLVFEKR